MGDKLRKLTGPSTEWQDKMKQAEENYKFQKQLTAKLDAHQGSFTETTLLEVVLWKTNRYPEITLDLLEAINALRHSYSNEFARTVLRRLLGLKGFDLPMASTVLRFACPDHLQIIDQRVYRLVMDEPNLKLPRKTEDKVELYFQYLERLKEVCEKYSLQFNKADRILYQLDKLENKDIPIKY